MHQSPGTKWFQSFCILWAAATLFHQASLWRVARNPVVLTLTIVAALVLFRRKRLGFLLLLSATQVAEVFVHAPYYSNHWMLTTTVNASLLTTAVVVAVTQRTWQPARDQVMALFVPTARCLILVMYFWAVFHKLNAGFFSPETSCATALLDGFGPMVPSWLAGSRAIAWLMIAATLVVETLIPVLLFLPRTRHLGAFTGAAFHFIIGFNVYEAYYNFSAALLAIFWLFLEPEFVESGIDSLLSRWERIARHSLYPFATFGLQLVFVYLLVWLGTWGNTSSKYQPLMVTVWVAYGLGYLGFVAWRLKSRGFGVERVSGLAGFVPRKPALLVIPVLFFLNGFGPYLGAKTEQSLAMFSNLVTENGVSNHFIVRRPLYLFPYQERVVEILESSDPFLEELREDRRGMVWFEFRDHLSRHPETSVTYRLNGEIIEVPRAGDLPEFQSSTNPLARKYLFFRHPDLDTPPRCQH